MSQHPHPFVWFVLLGLVGGCHQPSAEPAPAPRPPVPVTESTTEPPPSQRVAAGKSDAERMSDVHAIVQTIEDYRRATGRLPFAEVFDGVPDGVEAPPIVVHLASGQLPDEFLQPPPGEQGSILTRQEFTEYLAKALGPQVTLPVDTTLPPRFYQVYFDGADYFVSAALTEPNDHTFPLAPDWHKYQVGSRGVPEINARAFDEVE